MNEKTDADELGYPLQLIGKSFLYICEYDPGSKLTDMSTMDLQTSFMIDGVLTDILLRLVYIT